MVLIITELDGLHSNYWYRKLHETGYDSMLTAILFIKLSAYLHTEGKLPSGYRGRVEDIAFGMTNDPWPGVADLFPHAGSSSTSGDVQNSDAMQEDGGNHDNASLAQTSLGLSATESSSMVLRPTGSLVGMTCWLSETHQRCASFRIPTDIFVS